MTNFYLLHDISRHFEGEDVKYLSRDMPGTQVELGIEDCIYFDSPDYENHARCCVRMHTDGTIEAGAINSMGCWETRKVETEIDAILAIGKILNENWEFLKR